MSKKRVENKKGISPLIATVIIIGFTIVLAAGVIYWGTGFFKNIQEKTSQGAALNTLCAGDLSGLGVSARRVGGNPCTASQANQCPANVAAPDTLTNPCPAAPAVCPALGVKVTVDNSRNNVDLYGWVLAAKASATQLKAITYGAPPSGNTPTPGGAINRPGVKLLDRFNAITVDLGNDAATFGVPATPDTRAVTPTNVKTITVKPFVKANPDDANEVPSVCGNEVEATIIG